MTVAPFEAVEPTAAQEPKPKPAKPKTTAEPTEYVVLRRLERDTRLEDGFDGEDWLFVAVIGARSANEAIRKTVGEDTKPGTYVACPARSWKPVTVRAEVQTRLKLEST